MLYMSRGCTLRLLWYMALNSLLRLCEGWRARMRQLPVRSRSTSGLGGGRPSCAVFHCAYKVLALKESADICCINLALEVMAMLSLLTSSACLTTFQVCVHLPQLQARKAWLFMLAGWDAGWGHASLATVAHKGPLWEAWG